MPLTYKLPLNSALCGARNKKRNASESTKKQKLMFCEFCRFWLVLAETMSAVVKRRKLRLFRYCVFFVFFGAFGSTGNRK